MKISVYQPNSQGQIRIPFCIKILSFQTVDGEVTCHAVVDLLNTGLGSARFIVKHDGDEIDESLRGHYITTLNDQDGTHHIFEQPSILEQKLNLGGK